MDIDLVRQEAECLFDRLLAETLAEINALEPRALFIPPMVHKEGRHLSLTAKAQIEAERQKRQELAASSFEHNYFMRAMRQFMNRLTAWTKDDERLSESDLKEVRKIADVCAARRMESIRELVRARQQQALRDAKGL